MMLLLLGCVPPLDLPDFPADADTDTDADTDADTDTDTDTDTGTDADGDGWTVEAGDCDDGNARVYPDSDEHCDGVDNDCDAGTTEAGAVSVQGGASYATIQAALDAGGAEVWICGGAWSEALVVTHDVEIVGIDAPSLDAQGDGPVVRVEGALVVGLSGLTLQGGFGAEVDGATRGGGVYASEAALTLESCEVSANEAELGGGVYVHTLNLTATRIIDNSADDGGGVYVVSGGAVVADADTELADNLADGSGGGAWVGPDASWRGGAVRRNHATDGGGVALGDGARLTGVTAEENHASGYGGGVYADGVATVSRVDATGNQARYGAGLAAAGDLDLSNGTYATNAATSSGGALHLRNGVSTVSKVTISDNSAGFDGGGAAVTSGAVTFDVITFELNEAGRYGGGGYFDADATVVNRSTVQANLADDGAGLWARGDLSLTSSEIIENEATGWGGGISLEDGALTMVGGSLSANASEVAGGAAVRGEARTELTDVEVSSNVCSGAGGGLYLSGAFTITASQVFANLGERGGGLALVGADGTFDDSSIHDNEAMGGGGGVYLSNANATFSATSVTTNVATTSGGGAWVFDGGVTVLSGDWGDGADDNRPDDVVVGATVYAGFGSAAAFVCTSAAGECL